MSQLEEEYRRLLRWYPRAWREQNEEAMLDTLLEAAHHAGVGYPNTEDRLAITVAGLTQRAIGTGERSLVGTVALAAGIAFTAFYVLVNWDPAHSFSGYVGALPNASFVVGILLAISLLLSIRRLTNLARLVAMASVAVSIVIGLLAWQLSWLGPGLPTVVLYCAFGVCGLSRSNRIWRGLVLAAASLCAVVAAVSLDTMLLQSTFGPSPWWQGETALTIAGFATSAVLAWPWRTGASRLRASSSGSTRSPRGPAQNSSARF